MLSSRAGRGPVFRQHALVHGQPEGTAQPSSDVEIASGKFPGEAARFGRVCVVPVRATGRNTDGERRIDAVRVKVCAAQRQVRVETERQRDCGRNAQSVGDAQLASPAREYHGNAGQQ